MTRAAGAALLLLAVIFAPTPTLRSADAAPDSPSQVHRPTSAAPTVPAYIPVGEPVHGIADAVHAPRLAPGQYVDELASIPVQRRLRDRNKYYRVVLHAGDTPYFSATVVLPPRAALPAARLTVSLTMRALASGAIGCTLTSARTVRVADSPNAVTVVLAPGEVGGPQWLQRCPLDATYAVGVSRFGAAYASASLPLELGFRLEPPVLSEGAPGPAAPTANAPVHAATRARKISGGTNLDGAPQLSAGSYRDRVVTGETRYYRVHLSWGQRLAYTVRPDVDHRLVDVPGVSARMTILNPLRAVVGQPSDARDAGSQLGFGGLPLYGSTLAPVRYANRDSAGVAGDDQSLAPYAIDGDYYLAVAARFTPTGRRPITMPYRLTIDVVGRHVAAPQYVRGVPPAAQSSSSSTTPAVHRATTQTPSGGVPATFVAMIVAAFVGAGAFVLLLVRRKHAGGPNVMQAHSAALSPDRMPANRWPLES